MEKVKEYFKTLPKRFFLTAFSGMAQGLFVTLIAGTILGTIATKIIGSGNYFGDTLTVIANIAKSLMGAGIGVGIAYARFFGGGCGYGRRVCRKTYGGRTDFYGNYSRRSR